MPKDIEREVLTGPRTFDEGMEKLEIIVNEMMADDGPCRWHWKRRHARHEDDAE